MTGECEQVSEARQRRAGQIGTQQVSESQADQGAGEHAGNQGPVTARGEGNRDGHREGRDPGPQGEHGVFRINEGAFEHDKSRIGEPGKQRAQRQYKQNLGNPRVVR
jgi:hypothetical protein